MDSKSPKKPPISTEDLNDLMYDVTHIESLAVLVVERMEPMDEQTDSCMQLIKNQTRKINDRLDVLFKRLVEPRPAK